MALVGLMHVLNLMLCKVILEVLPACGLETETDMKGSPSSMCAPPLSLSLPQIQLQSFCSYNSIHEKSHF
jgi:hypothetical protein